MPKFISSIEGFNRSFIPEPNSGCWIWEKSLNNKGYGLLQCGGFKGYAHRFSYSEFKGPIPEGMHVCHRCDNPACVNPDHLWLGTPSDNIQDCRSKGRHAADNPATKYARGANQGLAKLSEIAVEEIRLLRGAIGQRQLARRYGVSKTAIRLAQQGRTWAHV